MLVKDYADLADSDLWCVRSTKVKGVVVAVFVTP